MLPIHLGMEYWKIVLSYLIYNDIWLSLQFYGCNSNTSQTMFVLCCSVRVMQWQNSWKCQSTIGIVANTSLNVILEYSSNACIHIWWYMIAFAVFGINAKDNQTILYLVVVLVALNGTTSCKYH